MPAVPLVSVVLPTYNRSQYVAKAISSIICQKTEFPFEIIVVDDASYDDTDKVVKRMSNECIKYIKLEKNSGGGRARNIGIQNAQGKYVAFIDSDTVWYPEKLQKQIELLEGDEIYIGCYSRFVKISGSESRLLPKHIPLPNDSAQKILLDNFIDTPTSIVRKDFLNIVGGFDESLPRFQDWELFIRLTKFGKFYGFHEPLIDSLDLVDSISKDDSARLEALQIIFEKHKKVILKSKESRSRFFLKIINANLIVKKRKEAAIFATKHAGVVGLKDIISAVMAIVSPRLITHGANRLRNKLGA